MTRDPASGSVERPYGWVVVAASLLLMTIATGGYYVVVVGLKPIAEEMDWPRWVPSLAYALAMLGMGAGGILMGRWSDRAGTGKPALIGALMVPAGAYLASLSSAPWSFVLAHGLLIGLLGNAALFSPLIANATHWFDRRRGVAVGIVSGGQGLAGALWPPVFRHLIEAGGWRQALVSYAIFALATMVPLSLLLRPRPPAHPEGREAGRGLVAGRALGLPANLVQALLCLAIVGCCVAMAMPMVHIVAHASDLGYPMARAAELLSVLLGGAFISRILWGLVADRIGGLRTLVVTSAGQAAMLASFIAVDELAGMYVIAALFGLALGGLIPCYAIVVREVFPLREAGWRIGTVYLFGTVGMALGGWLGGLIFDLSGGYRWAFAVGVAFNLGNLAITVPLLLRSRRLAPWPAAA